MDAANAAMCYALRNPPAGMQRASLKAIAGMVVKKDGTHPSQQTVAEAAKQFKAEKEKRGRKAGTKKTTAREDREILKKFKILRPPGHGIDSRKLHRALPASIRKSISRRTVIRRLADKGIKPQVKIRKSDFDVRQCKKRVALPADTCTRPKPSGHEISKPSPISRSSPFTPRTSNPA